jgi:uncharacterized protein YoxC
MKTQETIINVAETLNTALSDVTKAIHTAMEQLRHEQSTIIEAIVEHKRKLNDNYTQQESIYEVLSAFSSDMDEIGADLESNLEQMDELMEVLNGFDTEDEDEDEEYYTEDEEDFDEDASVE